MTKSALKIIAGIFLILATVWGFAFYVHVFGHGAWHDIPMFVTSFFLVGTGFFMIVSEYL